MNTFPLSPLRPSLSRNLNVAAANMTSGLTHYYEESTMRAFGCRVSEIRISPNRVFMVTIAKQSTNFDGTEKAYRVTAHDLTGQVIEEDGAERIDYPTLNKARAAMMEFLAHTDEKEVLQAALQRRLATLEWEVAKIRESLAQLA